MTKQQCLNRLDSIIESPRSQAAYWTALNYYDTVDGMSDDDFATVEPWYSNALASF